MRHAALASVLLVLLAQPAWAQEEDEGEPDEKPQQETLIKGGIDSGGFGALVFRFSGVNDQFAMFTAARGRSTAIDGYFTTLQLFRAKRIAWLRFH